MFHTIYRFWFLFHPLRDSVPADNWIGDDIYLAIVLFGVGGTALSVVGLTHLSLLVGENTVSVVNHKKGLTTTTLMFAIWYGQLVHEFDMA